MRILKTKADRWWGGFVLLTLPACFAAGWFARGSTPSFRRSVEASVRKLFVELDVDHIRYIPELGVILRPPQALVDRDKEVRAESPETTAERQRVIEAMRQQGVLQGEPVRSGPVVREQLNRGDSPNNSDRE